MEISKFTQEEIKFLEKSIKVGRSDDNKLVLTEVHADLKGYFYGHHYGYHYGLHEGDHIGNHKGDHYGTHVGHHFGNHEGMHKRDDGNIIDELNTIWEALHTYRETSIPESDPSHNKEWEDITYAMACIMEKLEITHSELD